MRFLATLPLAVAVLGCSSRYIANTQIEDTEENRSVLEVVEHYRRAMEDKDLDRILSLISDSFFEDPGTPHDPKDDYDKARLKERLTESFARLKEQRLDISPRKVKIDDEERGAQVEYVYDFRYLLALPQGDLWKQDIDVNRLTLRKEGETWKVVSGL